MSAGDVVVEVDELRKHYRGGNLASLFGRGQKPVRAVDGVSFSVREGENFGLVGESGSGKTTVAKLVLGLEQPTAGAVRFRGQAVHELRGRGLRAFRGDTHMVFQDPNSSLSPRMRVDDIVGEPLEVQGVRGKERAARVTEVLELVGMSPSVAERYPHEFSGGQRQRIAIARAITVEPALIVLDEPVSALDVSIRAQILNLLKSLQEELGLTYLTIAHDLAVVYQACDTTGVMYLGSLVELSSSEELFRRPLHPYTQVLLSAIPLPDPKLRHRRRLPLLGEIPSPSDPPPGCRFHTRCPYAVDRCRVEVPELREVEPGRWAACHFVEGDGHGRATFVGSGAFHDAWDVAGGQPAPGSDPRPPTGRLADDADATT